MGISLVVVHYDKCVFGEDANKFNPSRWLDHKDAVMMDKYMIHPRAGLRTGMEEKPNGNKASLSFPIFIHRLLSFYRHSTMLHH